MYLFDDYSPLQSRLPAQGLTEEELRNGTYRMIHNRIESEETLNTLNVDTNRNTYGYEEQEEGDSASSQDWSVWLPW